MEKPVKPKRRKASKKPTRRTPAGKMKSLGTYRDQLKVWVAKETEKDMDHQKDLAVWDKEMEAYNKVEAEVKGLKDYKPGDNVKAKKTAGKKK